MRLTRKELDDLFPTLVRYGGFALVFAITGLLAFGYPVASGYVPAVGMILYKTVKRAVEEDE